MRVTTLIAAVLALAGGFVVLRWMPGKPEKAAEPVLASADPSYEAELAILEEQHMLESSAARGVTPHAARDPGSAVEGSRR